MGDVGSVCGGDGSYALFPDLATATTIRYNINSGYTFASFVLTLLLMGAVTCLNTVYIPYFMKEHQVPLLFRNPDSSIYYDT